MIEETIVSDNKLYKKLDFPLFTTYQELNAVEQKELVPVFKGKPIPRQMWKRILSYMKQSYDHLKSETLVFLFYDESKDQPWSWWIPPQETLGMTVKSLPDDPEYAKQRANYPDTMFGTVHHHCSASAFQSGTDESDEVNREGIHFTIGNLNTNAFDIHCRITIGSCHSDIPAGTYIAQAADPFKKTAKVPDNIRKQVIDHLHTLDIVALNDNYLEDTFSDAKNVSKRVYTAPVNKYTQPGLGWNNYDEYAISKKNSPTILDEETSSEDAAEDLVDTILSDYEYENILINYYTFRNDVENNRKLYTAELESTEIVKDLLRLFEDEEFQVTREGKETLDTINKFIRQQKNYGLDITIEELIHGLSTLRYDEDGERVQPVDTKNVL